MNGRKAFTQAPRTEFSPSREPCYTCLVQYPHWRRLAAFYVASQTVSLLGSSIVHYAMIWYITLTTKSGSALAIAAVVGFLPTFLVSGFAGVWADRYSRRKLIVASDSLVAVATLLVMVAFMSGYQELWLMFVILAIRSLGSGIQSPAVNALTPQFVPPKRLMKVNGILGSVQSLGNVLTPAIAGLLMAFWPMYLIFAVDVVTAIIGIFLLLVFVRVGHHNPGATHETSQLQEFKLGLSYARHHFFVGRFLAYQAACTFFMGAPAILGSLMIARVFGDEPWRLATVETAFGIGAVIGGMAVSIWAGMRQEYRTAGIATTLIGALSLSLAGAPEFWCFAGLMAGIGLVVPYASVPTMTLLQRTVEPQQMGRVMSIFTMIATVMLPLGSGILSPLADAVDIRLVMAISGLGLGIAGLMLWHDRHFAQIPLPDTTPEPEPNQ